MNIVYALSNGRNGPIHYVGVTSRDPSHRLASHKSSKSCSPLGEWLRSVGKNLHLRVIEECGETDFLERERYWICHFLENGVDLFNTLKTKPYAGKAAVREYVPLEKRRVLMNTEPLIDALERRAFTARIPVSTLCKRAGISSATFSNWKSGVRPSAAKLGAVERAMDDIEREKR